MGTFFLATFFPFAYQFNHVFLEAHGGVNSAIFSVALKKNKKKIRSATTTRITKHQLLGNRITSRNISAHNASNSAYAHRVVTKLAKFGSAKAANVGN